MARAETAPAGTKPRIVSAAGSPRFTAERSACRTSQRRSGVGSRIHRREVAIKAVGLSLPMSFRLLGDRPANQEFQVVLEQVEQLEHRLRIVLEGAQRGAHGRRGRVPSATSRRTWTFDSTAHSRRRVSVRCYVAALSRCSVTRAASTFSTSEVGSGFSGVK